MPISHEHAFRRGMISRKAAAKIGVHGPRTGPDYQMVGNMSSTATDSTSGKTGIPQTRKDGINRHDRQRASSPIASRPRTGPEGAQPTANAINAPKYGKKYPAGGKATKQKRGFRGTKGGDANQTGHMYGGGLK